jgi:hypothetical protein
LEKDFTKQLKKIMDDYQIARNKIKYGYINLGIVVLASITLAIISISLVNASSQIRIYLLFASLVPLSFLFACVNFIFVLEKEKYSSENLRLFEESSWKPVSFVYEDGWIITISNGSDSHKFGKYANLTLAQNALYHKVLC